MNRYMINPNHTPPVRNKNSRRYTLHRKVRKQMYKIDVHKRTIYIPHDTVEVSKEVALLRDEFKYSAQLEIH